MVVRTLGDIFPYPYAYRNVRRNQQVRFAMDFCSVISAATTGPDSNTASSSGSCNRVSVSVDDGIVEDSETRRERERALVELAKEVAAGSNTETLALLHPLQFGAACLFDDGTVETAGMLKGLEYGCTVDPVSLLIREMCLRRGSNMIHAHRTGAVGADVALAAQYRSAAAPVCVAMADQFGVAHAPFAPARALLVEHGFEHCCVLYHAEGGELMRLLAGSLAPNRTLADSDAEVADVGADTGTRSLLCSDFFSIPQ